MDKFLPIGLTNSERPVGDRPEEPRTDPHMAKHQQAHGRYMHGSVNATINRLEVENAQLRTANAKLMAERDAYRASVERLQEAVSRALHGSQREQA